MTHIRAVQRQQVVSFCALYCAAKRDGCTIRDKHKARRHWGVKLESALRFEAMLEESGELEEGTTDPERIRELLLQLIMYQREQAPPMDEPTIERLADAMLEYRNNRKQRGIVASVALKHNVDKKSIWRYSNELKYDLERDPPAEDEVFRQLIVRKIADYQNEHEPYILYFGAAEDEDILPDDLVALEEMDKQCHLDMLQTREECDEASRNLQPAENLKRRLAEGSITSFNATDNCWTRLNRRKQASRKRARTTLMFAEGGNFPVLTLNDAYEMQVARVAEKKRKRIDRYRKRSAFIVFCEERSVDLNVAGDDQVVELTYEFDAKTSDKATLERLKEQWKWCRHNPKARVKLEKLMKRPAFIDFCDHIHQKQPEDLEEPCLFQTMHEFSTGATHGHS